MSRTVNEQEYEAKRNEILDVATRLIYSKGYQHLTIQDILEALDISRGALYHYFNSKYAILEAVIEHSAAELQQSLTAFASDPHLSAVEKIQGYFDVSTRWKTTRKDLIVSALRNLYSDENALIRQKLGAKSRRHVPKFLAPIIRQGVKEGVFSTPYPEEVASIFCGMTLSLADTIVDLFFSSNPDTDTLKRAQDHVKAYFDSVERILGAPPGSFKAVDITVFKDWPMRSASRSNRNSPRLTREG
jgi:TetR/AcrR family transcriptional regulator, transcriptional repressor for nem operon